MKVHAIQTGTVAVRTRQQRGEGSGAARQLRTLTDRKWTKPLPIYAWVIEHPEGLIVVDTGETAHVGDPGYFPRWHPYFRVAVRLSVRPEDEIGPRMNELGLSPGDVRLVILTHLHTDHAGGLSHFPGSEIMVSRRELENASGFAGKVRGFLPHRWPHWFSPTLFELGPESFGPFPGSIRVTAAADVTIVGTQGHTPGHVSVVLEDGQDTLFFAGDTSYSERLMLEGAIDGVSPDERAARATLDRIGELASQRPLVYLPSHDPEAGLRLERRQPVSA